MYKVMALILGPLIFMALSAACYIIRKRNIDCWLKGFLFFVIKNHLSRDEIFPRHIIFCFVDHFEPGNEYRGKVSLEEERQRVNNWLKRFPELATRHKDADGCCPKHTWFFPPHYDREGHLEKLMGLCKKGFGEIEMHLHHERMQPFLDTSKTLREKIEKCIAAFSRLGIFILPGRQVRYGFIHGCWALDNSLAPEYCGINDEITILKETGCYADFTFSTVKRSQPAVVNKIYYAKDDPCRRKSYNYGEEVVVGGKPWGDLMIIQGAIGLRWAGRSHKFYPSIEICSLDGLNVPSPERVDYWIRNAVRIKGRPDWLFVKIHAHGAIEMNLNNLLGELADKMYTYLEEKYNDTKGYFLHYVSSREMYNIIKAAEAGLDGEPNKFRDFEIPKYVYLREENG